MVAGIALSRSVTQRKNMTSQQGHGRSTTRRTLVKGAAWSVPVAVVAGNAPAMASSPIPPNGLNGWVELSRNCGRTYEFQIDGRGTFTGGGDNDRGIWTFVPDPNAQITNATIVFFFSRSDMTFNNQSGVGWSNLQRAPQLDGTSPNSGYYAYTTTYNGSWTYVPAHEAWVADSDPYWRSDLARGTCSTICAYARRSLTVNGETIAFTRGPVCV